VEPRFCERCGHALVQCAVEENHTRPVCPACGFIVYRNPPLAVGVIVERADGKVALVLRGENPGKGLWGLPAGFMEIDETTEQAAQRECFEETGLTVELGNLFGVWSFYHEQKRTSGVLVLYAARVVAGTPRAGSDSVEARFFALDEIRDEQLAFSTHRDALARWREQRAQGSSGAEVQGSRGAREQG
jgi:ADP-ribose pyrophosphatase YjhB (NUDIX family)